MEWQINYLGYKSKQEELEVQIGALPIYFFCQGPPKSFLGSLYFLNRLPIFVITPSDVVHTELCILLVCVSD